MKRFQKVSFREPLTDIIENNLIIVSPCNFLRLCKRIQHWDESIAKEAKKFHSNNTNEKSLHNLSQSLDGFETKNHKFNDNNILYTTIHDTSNFTKNHISLTEKQKLYFEGLIFKILLWKSKIRSYYFKRWYNRINVINRYSNILFLSNEISICNAYLPIRSIGNKRIQKRNIKRKYKLNYFRVKIGGKWIDSTRFRGISDVIYIHIMRNFFLTWKTYGRLKNHIPSEDCENFVDYTFYSCTLPKTSEYCPTLQSHYHLVHVIFNKWFELTSSKLMNYQENKVCIMKFNIWKDSVQQHHAAVQQFKKYWKERIILRIFFKNWKTFLQVAHWFRYHLIKHYWKKLLYNYEQRQVDIQVSGKESNRIVYSRYLYTEF